EDEALRAGLSDLLPPKSHAARLVEAVIGHSPFLARIVASRPQWLLEAMAEDPSGHLDRVLDAMRAVCAQATRDEDIMPALRQARQRVALLVALADLGGVWRLAEVTDALTR